MLTRSCSTLRTTRSSTGPCEISPFRRLSASSCQQILEAVLNASQYRPVPQIRLTTPGATSKHPAATEHRQVVQGRGDGDIQPAGDLLGRERSGGQKRHEC